MHSLYLFAKKTRGMLRDTPVYYPPEIKKTRHVCFDTCFDRNRRSRIKIEEMRIDRTCADLFARYTTFLRYLRARRDVYLYAMFTPDVQNNADNAETFPTSEETEKEARNMAVA